MHVLRLSQIKKIKCRNGNKGLRDKEWGKTKGYNVWEWILQRVEDRGSGRMDADGWGTGGISKQTGRWGGWVERYNDWRSAGNDNKRKRERDRPELCHRFIKQQRYPPPSPPLHPPPSPHYVFLGGYVGLIDAFTDRIKVSGNCASEEQPWSCVL